MNKQVKTKDGKVVSRGIEWTDYTLNPFDGCQHDCEWKMPDGTWAECYAKTVFEKMRMGTSFNEIHAHLDRMEEPLKLKEPARIFIDSMSDLMGREITDFNIQKVLDKCAEASWHTFQLLTKNPPRLRRFKFPPNLWVGVSAPPTKMYGNILTDKQQVRFAQISLEVLAEIQASVKWMSIEPLSWDIAPIIKEANNPLSWIVIGSATSGRKVYQPDWHHVQNVLDVAFHYGTPVFFKGNLLGNKAATPWREEFPKPLTIDSSLEEWFPPVLRTNPPTRQEKLL